MSYLLCYKRNGLSYVIKEMVQGLVCTKREHKKPHIMDHFVRETFGFGFYGIYFLNLCNNNL